MEKLKPMLDLIAHRGPDDRGAESGDWYALGHLRLSILDLSARGHQPMACAEGRHLLTYNGEIYNYRALRAELEARGRQFQSDTDTEVLLYGLAEEGPSFLKKCEGMFTGAFVDTQKKEALIFRDHLGIKPLYYTETNGHLYFASEVKALKPALGSFALNSDAVYENFQYRFVAGERTLYQHVRKILPGGYIHIANGRAARHSFYQLTDTLSDHPSKTADLEEIEALLEHSIHAHTLSDVGYSVQLSGGVDSSYMTSILSKQDKALDSYSITIPGFDIDEAPYQAEAVKRCGTKHHSFACTAADYAALLPKVTYHLDAPLVHTGTAFLYLLCKHIAQDHKVVLTGEGADELFLGYSRYALPLTQKMAFALKRWGVRPEWIPPVPKSQGLKTLLSRDLGMDSGSFYSDIRGQFTQSGDAPYREKLTRPYKTLLGQMMASDQNAYLVSLLERQDKIAMAYGLEARVPYCNHKLFEAVNAIHHAEKITPVPKAILKKIAEKYYPHDFIYRRKNGFKLPIDVWLRDKNILGQYFDLLTDQTFRERGFFNHAVIQTAIEQHLNGRKDYSKDLLNLIAFEIWLRQI